MRGVVLQGEVDMSHLKKTLHELESIVDRLERINKEQVFSKGKNERVHTLMRAVRA